MAFLSVKRIFEASGLTVDEFAAKFPVSRRTVYRWLNDDVAPSPMAIRRVKEIQKEVNDANEAAGGPSSHTPPDSRSSTTDGARLHKAGGTSDPSPARSASRREVSFLDY